MIIKEEKIKIIKEEKIKIIKEEKIKIINPYKIRFYSWLGLAWLCTVFTGPVWRRIVACGGVR